MFLDGYRGLADDLLHATQAPPAASRAAAPPSIPPPIRPPAVPIARPRILPPPTSWRLADASGQVWESTDRERLSAHVAAINASLAGARPLTNVYYVRP